MKKERRVRIALILSFVKINAKLRLIFNNNNMNPDRSRGPHGPGKVKEQDPKHAAAMHEQFKKDQKEVGFIIQSDSGDKIRIRTDETGERVIETVGADEDTSPTEAQAHERARRKSIEEAKIRAKQLQRANESAEKDRVAEERSQKAGSKSVGGEPQFFNIADLKAEEAKQNKPKGLWANVKSWFGG